MGTSRCWLGYVRLASLLESAWSAREPMGPDYFVTFNKLA
jgi:hypothetical protein